jgi:hypothetical protein
MRIRSYAFSMFLKSGAQCRRRVLHADPFSARPRADAAPVEPTVLAAQRGDVASASGSVFMSSRARIIRSRSLVGIARSARCAALARFNSQFTLQVFETHALAARVLFVGAAHRLDFLR